MSANPRTKEPLDVLQNMVDEILIETGKALRACSKEGGKDYATINARLQKNIPRTIETFHQALDDFECDIVKAKAVLIRDLEAIRSKRNAIEKPPQTIVEAHPSHQTENSNWAMDSPEAIRGPIVSPLTTNKRSIQQEGVPAIPQPSAPTLSQPLDLSNDDQPMIVQSPNNNNQAPTPPSSVQKPVGLGISTEAIIPETAPATQQHDSSLDDLFGTGDQDLNFDGIEFMAHSADPSQAQNDDFDMANFGNSQDFSMTDLNTIQTSNTNNGGMNKNDNDMFSMVNSQSADNMDLDFDLGAVDTDFNDMYDTGNELNHDLDSSFFES